MPITPQLVANSLPPNTCYPPTFQQLLNLIAQNLTVTGLDSSTFFSYGPTTPPVDAQGMPWLKTDAQYGFLGVYTFAGGAWTPAQLPFITGDIMMFNGLASSISDPWFFCDGIQNARGYTTPNLQGQMIICTGMRTLPAGSTDTAGQYNLGNTGGRETSILQAANLPAHGHTLLSRGPLALSGAGGGTSYVPNTSADDTAQNAGLIAGGNTTGSTTDGSANPPNGFLSLPPYYALAFKMYIAPTFP